MNAFLEKVKKIYSESDSDNIVKALDFAFKAHDGQFRVSGEPYILHPIKVADTLIDLGLDGCTIIASLLHDVVEDTKVTDSEIKKVFGADVAMLVAGVTKLSRIVFNSVEEEQADNIRNLFFAMAKDLRVILIKLADRLHNMRTLGSLPQQKQMKKAKETLDIYAPLAGRMGISSIKCELEDLSMKYIYPEDYKYLTTLIDTKRGERMKFVDRIAAEIQEQLTDLSIKGEVKGRPKHFYSIWKKMKTQDKTLEQIYDLIAVRVIVENIKDCYTVLGVIHSIWKPIPGRFKDYIAMPKPNLYQSLHTTVVTNFGQTFEIQIRTFEMNRIAEYGIAAHWKYKEGRVVSDKTPYDSKLGWIKEVMDVQGDLKDSLEFVDALKLDVFSNEIYVFSPKGDVFDLMNGATCIDFAYRVHSAVGNKCVGAKVNNKIVPLNFSLQNGDVVEVLTSNNSKGPSRDWLKIVKTPTAKAKIRSFFKKEMQVDNIKLGKEMLEKEAKHRGYVLNELLVPAYLKIVMDRYMFSSVEDMYASVGYGGVTTNQVLLKLIDFYKKEQAYNQNDDPQNVKIAPQPKAKNSGVLIDGYDGFLIRLSHCCNPVPGDDIVGYIVKGKGVSVHRNDCPNLKGVEVVRLVDAKWPKDGKSLFTVMLHIKCYDKNGLLNQISSVISNQSVPIVSMEARLDSKGVAVINIGLQVKDLVEVEVIIKKLENNDSVIAVDRNR